LLSLNGILFETLAVPFSTQDHPRVLIISYNSIPGISLS
jgi:hypothetical protein